jgi:hypothetical protein
VFPFVGVMLLLLLVVFFYSLLSCVLFKDDVIELGPHEKLVVRYIT